MIYTEAHSKKILVNINKEMTIDECRNLSAELRQAAVFAEIGSYDKYSKVFMVLDPQEPDA